MAQYDPDIDYDDEEERQQVMSRILYGGLAQAPLRRDAATADVSTCWSADGREDQDLRPKTKWPKPSRRKGHPKDL